MEHYIRTKDFMVSGEEFELRCDTDMDLLVTSPKPPDLAPYYQSEEYISHTDSDKGLISKLYQRVKKFTVSRKVKLFMKFASDEKSLLDVGAGTGDLLVEAQKKGFDTYGVEPNEIARRKATLKGVHLAEDYPADRKFSIISLWHVLEHLPEPEKEIARLGSLLRDNGTLFIAVPNFKSYDAKYYREHWAAYDVPRHLWHFSKAAMAKLCEGNSLKIIDIKPMVFDAFYVSLLSEKYRSGRNNFLKAMSIGTISNLKAMRTGEYSSLLYIIKKA